MTLTIEECSDGGGARGAAALVESLGFYVPAWAMSKVQSYRSSRNNYLRNHPDIDMRVLDIRATSANPNQQTFDFS